MNEATAREEQGVQQTADGIPVCQKPGDFWAMPSRRLIARLCRAFLDEYQITPTELLHDPRRQKSFDDTGSLRRKVLERAARLQAPEDAAGRTKKLNDLADKATHLTRTRLSENPPPTFDNRHFADQVSRTLGDSPGFEAWFQVDAGLTTLLQDCTLYADRLDRLLALVADAPADSPADEAAGRIIGEILAAPSVLMELADRREPLRDVLLTAVALYHPDEALPDAAARRAVSLKAWLDTREAEAARTGLGVGIQLLLGQEERLVPSGEGDLLETQAVMDELLAIGDLAGRLRRARGGFVGGRRTADLLERRVSRLVSDERLQELVRGKNYYHKIKDLFDLQQAVFGESSRRQVDDYLRQLLESRELGNRLLDSGDTMAEKLKVLADVQGMVDRSQFPLDERQDLARELDNIQYTYCRTEKLFQHTDKNNKKRCDKTEGGNAVFVLEQLAAGHFTRGQSRDAAHAYLAAEAHRPRFFRAYMAGASEGSVIAERMKSLSDKLHAAGIPFPDLASLRILLVEDEAPARDFAAMILQEMGIQTIDTAQDGREGLDRFSDNEDAYDLIICDWKMPRMDGLELLKQVRSVRPNVPFLMVTVMAEMKSVQEAINHDVTAYIAKPYPPEQLEEKVLTLVVREADRRAGMQSVA